MVLENTAVEYLNFMVTRSFEMFFFCVSLINKIAQRFLEEKSVNISFEFYFTLIIMNRKYNTKYKKMIKID